MNRFFIVTILLLICHWSVAQHKSISKPILPEQVPYLNEPEDYLVGNGIGCASGSVIGEWNFIAGHGYTSPNYISSEKIKILIDGVETSFITKMYRARETGLYYGVSKIDDLKITLLDFSLWEVPSVNRLVIIENLSAVVKHTIQLKAIIKTPFHKGRINSIVKDLSGNNAALSIQLDTSLYSMFGDNSGWVKNPSNKFLLAAWTDNDGTAGEHDNSYWIASGTKQLPPKSVQQFSLYHYLHLAKKKNPDVLAMIRQRNGIKDASQSIREWQQWMRNVPANFHLNKIKDKRARDIVEGGLSVIKTNQTSAGGMVANEKIYNLSWTRDAYCGLRAMLACGHTNESKKFIQFMHKKYKAHGFIPNAVSCDDDGFALYNGNEENNPGRHFGAASPCPEANTAPETTALLLLAARDYYKATHDNKTLLSADASLTYAMNIQLKHLIRNGYKLEFSGDETELCGAVNTSAAGYNRNLSLLWSMSSVALCSASLEFYIEYILMKQQDPSNYKNNIDGVSVNLYTVLKKLGDVLDKDFWRTDSSGEGYYEWALLKQGHNFPPGRIVNFSLFPLYYRTTLKDSRHEAASVSFIKRYYNSSTKSLPLVPVVGDGSWLGHNLGYLLWSMVLVNDADTREVYDALVNGSSVKCWGSYDEAYNTEGKSNNKTLRTFETGVNIDAIAAYWKLGGNEMPVK